MRGACQTRTFDLPFQPLSRYALVFPVTGNSADGYEVDSSRMAAIGDINLYEGNVSANRGEVVVDVIYSNCNWEVGVGYALSAQGAETLSCDTNNNFISATFALGQVAAAGYGLVGNALQYQVGVGPVTPATDATTNNAIISENTTGATATFTPGVQFFNLGKTNQIAKLDSGKTAAFDYGTPVDVDSADFVLLGQFGANCSGLMAKQILNRIFGHIDYVWRDCSWQPEIGILGSIGFSPCNSLTAAYWDVGGRIGFAF
jgi:hypothetical protein